MNPKWDNEQEQAWCRKFHPPECRCAFVEKPTTSKKALWWGLPLDWQVLVGPHWIVVCDGFEDSVYYDDGAVSRHPYCVHNDAEDTKGPGLAATSGPGPTGGR